MPDAQSGICGSGEYPPNRIFCEEIATKPTFYNFENSGRVIQIMESSDDRFRIIIDITGSRQTVCVLVFGWILPAMRLTHSNSIRPDTPCHTN